ncbi:MAG: type III pantothenate kinase [Bacteroidetes bacterium]|nr:type III pantothenate kinase [Bacteroidota bacterium]
MERTLCLDFGNSRQKVALFEAAELKEVRVLPDTHTETVEHLLREWNPGRCILSSVIEHEATLPDMLEHRTRFHLLSHHTRLNFTTPVGKPESIGADRLALCSAAVHFYPRQNNLIIALGTCITYNFINRDHAFLGGGISAGLSMRLKAMHQQTALLPLIEPKTDVPLVGYDTETNMLSGTALGMAHEIDGFIESYRERYGNFNAVLTGGDLPYLVSHLKSEIFADPDFLFKGLYAIAAHNLNSHVST